MSSPFRRHKLSTWTRLLLWCVRHDTPIQIALAAVAGFFAGSMISWLLM